MANIFYLNPHNVLSGGNKIVYEHCNHLAERFQKCFIICNDQKPDWFDVNAYFINKDTALKIMRQEDIIVFHWDGEDDINYVMECPAQNKYYLVQSYIHNNYSIFKKHIKFIAVSTYIKNHLKNNFNIESTLIMNAIDHTIFFKKNIQRNNNRVFAINKGGMKGVQDIKAAEKIIKRTYHDTEFVYLDNLLPGQIADEFLKAEIFVSASWFEGFGLPVLEAMACGAVVVCTDSKGIDDFAFHNDNCLKVPIKSPEAIAEAIITLFNNPEKVSSFRKKGFEVAQNFCWNNTIDNLANLFNLKEKKNDIDIIREISKIKLVTTIENSDINFFGKSLKYKHSILIKLEHIKGGKRLLHWLNILGYPLKFTVGDFDYQKVCQVDKPADKEIYINNNGDYIFYFPELIIE